MVRTSEEEKRNCPRRASTCATTCSTSLPQQLSCIVSSGLCTTRIRMRTSSKLEITHDVRIIPKKRAADMLSTAVPGLVFATAVGNKNFAGVGMAALVLANDECHLTCKSYFFYTGDHAYARTCQPAIQEKLHWFPNQRSLYTTPARFRLALTSLNATRISLTWGEPWRGQCRGGAGGDPMPPEHVPPLPYPWALAYTQKPSNALLGQS